MAPLRAAIFGMGGFARLHHEALQTLERQGAAKLVATCDLAPEAFPDLRANLEARGVEIYSDWSELLENHGADLDFATIATPIPLHAPMHRACVEKGVAVYLEKPPTLDPRELEAMISTDKRARRASAVGFNFIGESARQNLKTRLVAGEFGALRRAGFLAHWPRPESYFARAAWAGKLVHNGYLVLDSCVGNALAHYVHNLLFWCGKERENWGEVAEIEAALFRAHAIESFDTVWARGVCGKVEIAVGATHAGSGAGWQREWLECENAQISYVTRGGGWEIRWNDGRHESGETEAISTGELLTRNMRQFLETLHERATKPLTTLEDSRPFVHFNALLFVAAREIFPAPFRLETNEDGVFRAIENIESALEKFAQTGEFPIWAPQNRGRATLADLPQLEDAIHEILAQNRTPMNYPWTPDNGDGTFCNPILLADYSDPDIVRHGEDYYLVASSFNCTPALPILHSRDLVNWELVAHAVGNMPHPRYGEVQLGCGVWAPAIRFHDGKFWIFFPMPDEGIFVTTARDPRGPWSQPHCLVEGKGLIDPCPLWDEDGRAYLVHAYARSRAGIKHRLRVVEMAPDASHLMGEGQIVYDNEAVHPTLEGPKWLKKDGWYYILAPAGGVKTGWQVVFRSRSVFGPYEDKIVLAQGETPINGPHQGGLTDTPNGEWWFVHFQDAYVYGRIVHLQPVEWVDGWPLMGENGQPVLHHAKPNLPAQPVQIPATSDEFGGENLGLQWQWEANHRPEWFSLAARPGFLRLFAQPLPGGDLRRAPHVLGQKFPARAFRVQTRLELNAESAGLVVMGREHAALTLSGSEVIWSINGEEKARFSVPEGVVSLAVEVEDGGLCRFFWNENAVEPPFQAVAGHWIGARVGLFCGGAEGFADFEYFRFLAPQNGAK